MGDLMGMVLTLLIGQGRLPEKEMLQLRSER